MYHDLRQFAIDAIPEVHWAGGKAGTEVAPEIAARIEALWKEHLGIITK